MAKKATVGDNTANPKLMADIKAVCKSATEIGNQIHEIALRCMSHAMECGDVRPAQALVSGLPTSARREALRAWFHDHSPIRIQGKQFERFGLVPETQKGYTPFNIEAAKATPYWNADEAKGFNYKADLSIHQVMAAALKREYEKINKAIREHRSEKSEYVLNFDPIAKRKEIVEEASKIGVTLDNTKDEEWIPEPIDGGEMVASAPIDSDTDDNTPTISEAKTLGQAEAA